MDLTFGDVVFLSAPGFATTRDILDFLTEPLEAALRQEKRAWTQRQRAERAYDRRHGMGPGRRGSLSSSPRGREPSFGGGGSSDTASGVAPHSPSRSDVLPFRAARKIWRRAARHVRAQVAQTLATCDFWLRRHWLRWAAAARHEALVGIQNLLTLVDDAIDVLEERFVDIDDRAHALPRASSRGDTWTSEEDRRCARRLRLHGSPRPFRWFPAAAREFTAFVRATTEAAVRVDESLTFSGSTVAAGAAAGGAAGAAVERGRNGGMAAEGGGGGRATRATSKALVVAATGEGRFLATLASMVPTPGEPTYAAWTDVPLAVFAAQWTLLDWSLFASVPVMEWLEAGFDDPRFKHVADGVRRCIDRYNAESLWVANEVLQGATPAARANLYVRLLTLALHLRRLNNFFGLSAVLTGLRNDAVTRLKHTRSKLPAAALDQLDQLVRLFHPASMYRAYLQALSAVPVGHPAVPHLGPVNQALVALANQIPSKYPKDEKLVHVTHWRELYQLIAVLVEFQDRTYSPAEGSLRGVCAMINSALRAHTFYFDEDAEAARTRLARTSAALEPDDNEP